MHSANPPNLPYLIRNISAAHIMVDQVRLWLYIKSLWLVNLVASVLPYTITYSFRGNSSFSICRITIQSYSILVWLAVEFFQIEDQTEILCLGVTVILTSIIVLQVCWVTIISTYNVSFLIVSYLLYCVFSLNKYLSYHLENKNLSVYPTF